MFNYFWRNSLYTCALSKNMVVEQNNWGGGYVFEQTEVGSLVPVIKIRKAEEEQNKSVRCFLNHLLNCLQKCIRPNQNYKLVQEGRSSTHNTPVSRYILKYFSRFGTLKFLIIHSVSLICIYLYFNIIEVRMNLFVRTKKFLSNLPELLCRIYSCKHT